LHNTKLTLFLSVLQILEVKKLFGGTGRSTRLKNMRNGQTN